MFSFELPIKNENLRGSFLIFFVLPTIPLFPCLSNFSRVEVSWSPRPNCWSTTLTLCSTPEVDELARGTVILLSLQWYEHAKGRVVHPGSSAGSGLASS